MSLKRFSARRDRTEREIVKALRAVGAKVLRLGTFDLLVLYRHKLTMLECKSEKGRLTKSQFALIGDGWPVHFVRTPTEALMAIGYWRG